VVHRWAYDYSVPGAARDFVPQNVPPEETAVAGSDEPRPGKGAAA